MSHTIPGQRLGPPHGDGAPRLTDLYAFGKTGRRSQVDPDHERAPVVQPAASRATRSDPFAHEAIYELKIDTDVIPSRTSPTGCGFPSSREGAKRDAGCVRGAAAAGVGDGETCSSETAPVSLGRTPRVTEVGEHRLFAGWRSDPFFFDVLGVLDGFKFTQQDFSPIGRLQHRPRNPQCLSGAGRVGIWARTLDGAGGRWVQADRGARLRRPPS